MSSTWADDYSSEEGSVDADTDRANHHTKKDPNRKQNHERPTTEEDYGNDSYSAPYIVSVSNINYACTRQQVGEFFEANDCTISKLQLNVSGNRFNGSAMMELRDECSMKRCLSMAGMILNQKAIRVRPWAEYAQRRHGREHSKEERRRGGDPGSYSYERREYDNERVPHNTGGQKGDFHRGGSAGGRIARRDTRDRDSRDSRFHKLSSHDSAASADSAEPAPPSRPRIQLQPRTLPIEDVGKPVAAVSSSIYGEGRPQDDVMYEEKRRKENSDPPAVRPPAAPTEASSPEHAKLIQGAPYDASAATTTTTAATRRDADDAGSRGRSSGRMNGRGGGRGSGRSSGRGSDRIAGRGGRGSGQQQAIGAHGTDSATAYSTGTGTSLVVVPPAGAEDLPAVPVHVHVHAPGPATATVASDTRLSSGPKRKQGGRGDRGYDGTGGRHISVGRGSGSGAGAGSVSSNPHTSQHTSQQQTPNTDTTESDTTGPDAAQSTLSNGSQTPVQGGPGPGAGEAVAGVDAIISGRDNRDSRDSSSKHRGGRSSSSSSAAYRGAGAGRVAAYRGGGGADRMGTVAGGRHSGKERDRERDSRSRQATAAAASAVTEAGSRRSLFGVAAKEVNLIQNKVAGKAQKKKSTGAVDSSESSTVQAAAAATSKAQLVQLSEAERFNRAQQKIQEEKLGSSGGYGQQHADSARKKKTFSNSFALLGDDDDDDDDDDD